MAALGAAGAIGKAAGAMNARKALGGAQGAKDKLSTEGSASDQVSTGEGGASDHVSTSDGSSSSNRSRVAPSEGARSAGGGGSGISIGGHRGRALSSSDSDTSQSISGGARATPDANRVPSGGDRQPSSDSSNVPLAQPTRAAQGPYVPMEKLDSMKVNQDLSGFLQERNLDASNIKSFSMGEFSRYVAFSSEERRFEKVKGTYEAMLSQTFADKGLKGHEADFVNKVESMFSGTQLDKIREINDRVMQREGVPRKALSHVHANPEQASSQGEQEPRQSEQAPKRGDGSENR